MHPYNSQILAADHLQQLRAEADRARLATASKRMTVQATARTPQRPFRLSLGRLLHRVA